MKPKARIGETRRYWMVCEAREDGKWNHHGFFRETQEEGERRLRWLRQWYPNAFLVEMLLTRCEETNVQPPLPLRASVRLSTNHGETSEKPAGKPLLHLV